MNSDIRLEGFTVTSLLVTAIICLVAVLVAWYTVRDRVKFSQIILGLFCYVVVMVLEGLFGLQTLQMPPAAYGLYIALTTVLCREVVRFAAMRFGVRSKFDSADAAIGFAIGFGGLYLFVCAAYYFSCYTTAREFVRAGMDAFLVSTGENSQEALALVENIAAQSGWELIATAVNRVFFLVREISLCVLLWYAMEARDWKWYALVPLAHLVAILPDGFYQAGLLGSGLVRDLLVCLLSAGIAALAARKYNANEDQVAHYQIEHLRARRRR